MKVSAKEYAEILYSLVKDIKEAEIKRVVKNFIELLVTNRDMGKLGVIAEKFGLIWNENEGITEARLISSRILDEEIKSGLKKYVAGITGTKKVILEEKVDKNILGGVVIKYNDKVIDGSLRENLKLLRDKMAK